MPKKKSEEEKDAAKAAKEAAEKEAKRLRTVARERATALKSTTCGIAFITVTIYPINNVIKDRVYLYTILITIIQLLLL
jgi:hypothetical protein